MNNKRALIIRIVAIVLCALLVLGIVTAALSAFAAGPAPVTGSRDMKEPIFLAVAAAVLLAACILVPKIAKKKEQ
ncbi:MAG: hypothetical protein IK080_11955 [Clostridia bacterium]|nr:hypothetical protein [Clostridia bacterium]